VSKSPGKTPSSSDKAQDYYRSRRSQERRTSPCQRRKSTESGTSNLANATLLLPGES